MRKPKVGRLYFLVRVLEGHVHQVEFIRFADDSVSVVANGRCFEVEFDPNAWQWIWADLESQGYVEVREAKTMGIIPETWVPNAEPLYGLKRQGTDGER